MDNNIVAYKNELNTIPLRNFNSAEIDFLCTILSTMRNKGTEQITFDFAELRELSKYKPTANSRFANDLEKTYDKLISLNIKIGDDSRWTKFVLFTEYTVDLDNEEITIGTNPKFAPMINNLENNFTKFELEEMVSLKSSYSKNAYRLLKQFRSTGFYKVTIDDFRELMDIPKSYQMFNIRQTVFEPILTELPIYFKNLKITEIKGIGKKKRSTVALEFTFIPQKDIHTDDKGKSFVIEREKDNYKTTYAEDMTAEQIDKYF